ncbi:MAG: carbonate dehydratase [Schleiferiaceae bacterium]
MLSYDQVFANNKEWAAGKKATEAEFFNNLSKGQSPEYLYIGCSDSRVTAEDLMGAGPGDVFVHRNIANMVVSTDVSSMSVIDYAVTHLGVKHIVICGHYFCGGVKAAMTKGDLGIINPWLQNIRDVYRLHAAELDAIADENDRYNRLIELNVVEQCVNITKNPSFQAAYAKGSGIEIHGWVFDVASGELVDLNVNTADLVAQTTDTYNLGY